MEKKSFELPCHNNDTRLSPFSASWVGIFNKSTLFTIILSLHLFCQKKLCVCGWILKRTNPHFGTCDISQLRWADLFNPLDSSSISRWHHHFLLLTPKLHSRITSINKSSIDTRYSLSFFFIGSTIFSSSSSSLQVLPRFCRLPTV